MCTAGDYWVRQCTVLEINKINYIRISKPLTDRKQFVIEMPILYEHYCT